MGQTFLAILGMCGTGLRMLMLLRVLANVIVLFTIVRLKRRKSWPMYLLHVNY